MAGFPFMRQAEAFRSSLPFILLLAVFILPCPMSAAAKPRPAIAFVHLLLPPGGEPHASPAGWIGSLDRARDTLESLRIPTIVSSASPGNAEDLNELSEMDAGSADHHKPPALRRGLRRGETEPEYRVLRLYG